MRIPFARQVITRLPKEQLNGDKLLKLYLKYIKDLNDATDQFTSKDSSSLDLAFKIWNVDLEFALEDLLLEKFPNYIPHKILQKLTKDNDLFTRSQAIVIKMRDHSVRV
jgi:hypothetical protein